MSSKNKDSDSLLQGASSGVDNNTTAKKKANLTFATNAVLTRKFAMLLIDLRVLEAASGKKYLIIEE